MQSSSSWRWRRVPRYVKGLPLDLHELVAAVDGFDGLTGGDNPEGFLDWFAERLDAHLKPWKKREGQLAVIRALWVKDGVAHHWSEEADWFAECLVAAEQLIEGASEADSETARLRTDKETLRLHKLAEALATHERFPEATNDAKRNYVVNEPFPRRWSAASASADCWRGCSGCSYSW